MQRTFRVFPLDQLRDVLERSGRRKAEAGTRHLNGRGKHLSFGHANKPRAMNRIGKTAPALTCDSMS
ncbi:hypothetical protein CLU95_0924 [Variovorax sp. 54]|nr:hypothetical protein CLU95_0924 [Variovorax sp. 54]